MAQIIDSPVIANDHSIERILAVSLPILIVLWNGPILPEGVDRALVDLAYKEAGRLLVVKINAGENPQSARRLGTKRMPTLTGLHEGKEVTRAEPLTSADDVQAHARFLLGRGARPQTQRPSTQVKLQARRVEEQPILVTDATFEREVLHSSLPVLVDFWAPWCGPCHAIAPLMDKLARDYAGRLRVVKANVDENPHYAGLYSIQGIPSLLFFHHSKVINRLVGAMPESHLRAEIEQVLRA